MIRPILARATAGRAQRRIAVLAGWDDDSVAPRAPAVSYDGDACHRSASAVTRTRWPLDRVDADRERWSHHPADAPTVSCVGRGSVILTEDLTAKVELTPPVRLGSGREDHLR